MRKGKMFFNIIFILIIISLISAIGYVAYYYINDYISVKEAEKIVDEFENDVIVVGIGDENIETGNTQTNEQNQTTNSTNSTKKSTSKYYKGYSMIGSLQIPKVKIKVPIVDKVTPQSISAAVGTLYGPGPNKVGNTVYVAHNYRNRKFFW